MSRLCDRNSCALGARVDVRGACLSECRFDCVEGDVGRWCVVDHSGAEDVVDTMSSDRCRSGRGVCVCEHVGSRAAPTLDTTSSTT
uniref:Uncharacterized protein n=1 Tax=Parascaris univalens TaxID=6257 RepID=A0A915CFD7_PARUN